MKSKMIFMKVVLMVGFILFTGIALAEIGGGANDNPAMPSWFIEDIAGQDSVLKSGNSVYCDRDFEIQNMGMGDAAVQVIFENGASYTWDTLPPNGTKSYSLGGSYPLSMPGANSVKVDEARIVNVTGGESNLKIICK